MQRILKLGIIVILGAAVILLIATSSGGLAPGNPLPAIQVAGWANGGPPSDLDGKIVVLEVFATW